MLSVWRITTAAFARSAFSGEGARLYGGRWNPKGVPIVYTAASQSLALLEMLVQDQPLRARYVIIEARIPGGLRMDRFRIDDLPSDSARSGLWLIDSRTAECGPIRTLHSRRPCSLDCRDAGPFNLRVVTQLCRGLQ